jgi:ribonuclease HII
VAGVDEAGRGACAGPLVVAACVLRPGAARRLEGLTDSKLLTPLARDRMYEALVGGAADYAVVVIPAEEVDRLGVHVVNIEGMRRAVAQLPVHPGYVLVDGFRVPGLTAPSVPVVKGDQAAACVAGASVLAKVTRDRIMAGLHTDALERHGPSGAHRWSYVNVTSAALRHGMRSPRRVVRSVAATAVVHNEESR